MTPPIGPPPIRYVSVYRLAIPTPDETVGLGTFGSVEAHLVKGPFALERSVPLLAYGAGSASMTLGTERAQFPPGAFLVFSQDVDVDNPRISQIAIRRASGGCGASL